MNATAVPSSLSRNFCSAGDRKDRSLFAARIAAIILIALISTNAFVAYRILTPPLRSLLRSPFSASSPRVLWLFIIIVAAAIWILHHAASPPPRDSSVHYASGWTAQFWHEVDGIYPPMMSEYYYDNDVNATGESAFEAEVTTRKSTRVVEPPKEEEKDDDDDDDDDSMEATWEAIVRRPRERVESAKGAIDLRRRVMNKEGGVKVEKKKEREEAAKWGGGWRKREALVVANDELFRRVETLIKKHYDHLKLQRQESEQRRVLEMFHRRGCS